MAEPPLTEHTVTHASGARTFYLASGPSSGKLMIFCHGWPELSHSWRHQLVFFGLCGFRCIAPDMRGYGRSTVPTDPRGCSNERCVEDMTSLLAHLGGSADNKAVFVGHDWGAPIVWQLASHYPELCHAVINLSVGYRGAPLTEEKAVAAAPKYGRYSEKLWQFRAGGGNADAAGPVDYQVAYIEHFDEMVRDLEANIPQTVKAIFRRSGPELLAAGDGRFTEFCSTYGQRARIAAGENAFLVNIPKSSAAAGGEDLERDDMITEADMHKYIEAMQRTGLRAGCSWYLNHDVNAIYTAQSKNGGVLAMPVLYISSSYDAVCKPERYAGMGEFCTNLTKAEPLPCGHWIQQEMPRETNGLIAQFLAMQCAEIWPAQMAKQ